MLFVYRFGNGRAILQLKWKNEIETKLDGNGEHFCAFQDQKHLPRAQRLKIESLRIYYWRQRVASSAHIRPHYLTKICCTVFAIHEFVRLWFLAIIWKIYLFWTWAAHTFTVYNWTVLVEFFKRNTQEDSKASQIKIDETKLFCLYFAKQAF